MKRLIQNIGIMERMFQINRSSLMVATKKIDSVEGQSATCVLPVYKNGFSRLYKIMAGKCIPVVIMFFLLLFCFKGQAQVTMPDMVAPGDTWGIIDVNKLYGGCMQVDSYSDLLNMDVQFLKRGMLFIVYDYDGDNSNGLTPKAYMFLPASGTWSYNTPFEIPAAEQGKTISTDGLEPGLKEINFGLSNSGDTNPATANAGDVFYNTPDAAFYVYNGTDWQKIAFNGSDSGGTNPSIADAGDVFYNTTDAAFYVYDGTDWQKISTAGSTPNGDNNPATANKGDLFYNTNDSTLYVYNGSEWSTISDAGDNLGNHTATEALKMGAFPISNDGDDSEGLIFDTDGNATFNNNLTINGDLYTPSDKRLKTNIETLTNVLEKIDKLRGVQFEYKDQKKYAAGPKIGVIAQELLICFPPMVTKGSDGYFKVDYTQLTGALLQAIKEQQKEIKQQNNRIEQLENRMNKLEQQINIK